MTFGYCRTHSRVTRLLSIVRGIATILATFLIGCTSASADPILFSLPSFPDLSGVFVNVQYNPGTGSFSACGYVDVLATSPAPGTPANSFPPCDYSLQANISSGGVFSAAGSTLSISGGLPFYLPTAIPDGSLLLAGNLSAFDYTPGDLASNLPTVFRFLVDVTADPFNLGFGQLAGVLTSADNIFVTDFQSAFSGTARVDTFDQSVPEVPEPATLLLVGSGIAAVVRRRRFGARRS